MIVGNRLLVQGTNVLDAIANSGGGGSAIDATSNTQVASVTAGGVTPSEAGVSSFEDLQAVNVRVNTIRALPTDDLIQEASNTGEALRI